MRFKRLTGNSQISATMNDIAFLESIKSKEVSFYYGTTINAKIKTIKYSLKLGKKKKTDVIIEKVFEVKEKSNIIQQSLFEEDQ